MDARQSLLTAKAAFGARIYKLQKQKQAPRLIDCHQLKPKSLPKFVLMSLLDNQSKLSI